MPRPETIDAGGRGVAAASLPEAREEVRTGPPLATRVVDSGSAEVEQWIARELGNSSYLVVDRDARAAVVIDPLRDVDGYLSAVRGRGCRVSATLETHVHNDFVSGGPDLRAAAAAAYIVPSNSGIAGADRELSDGEDVAVGSLRLRAIHSPGHTPEHLSYLLVDGEGRMLALFSGGALMVGTMARPDLLGPSHTYAQSHRGRDTLRNRLLTLPEELCVLPTHGAGSFCGAASSERRVTTIGRERRENPLATAPDFAHFLAIHAKQGRYPAYYARMAPLNRRAQPATAVSPQRVSPNQFQAAVEGGAVAVDCRAHRDFDSAHVPGSLCVPGEGAFSAWVGWIVDIDAPLILVAGSARAAEEATRQLVRIGFHDLRGWLDPRDWIAEGRAVGRVPRCTMAELSERILDGHDLTVIDMRQGAEWAGGHLPGAVHTLAPDLPAIIEHLDHTSPIAVHCATGYRSALGVSLLLRHGITEVWHVTDGVEAWSALGHPLVTTA
ncbi:MAG: MBL fold metallo-hydrolase [Candidatus Dormibacteria bacterium]